MASASWLRQELPMQTNSTRSGFGMAEIRIAQSFENCGQSGWSSISDGNKEKAKIPPEPQIS
jgi:hypothetical protein